MNWLIGSGQILVGIGVVAAWYFALRLLSGRTLRMTNLAFSILPAAFLIWAVLGIILIVNGIEHI
jgi:hypothetical protein